jgi:Bacterial pre-peptidase C-terminal domain
VSTGVITVSTAGGQSVLRASAVTLTTLPNMTPAADVGDTLATALNLNLGLNQALTVANVDIAQARDVDLFRVQLGAGDQLDLTVTSGTYTYLRIFDVNGVQLATSPSNLSPGSNPPIRWTAPAAGTYYVGMSGWNYTDYNPQVANSGTRGVYTGGYSLRAERLSPGANHLAGLSANALSGTASNTTIASANVGQVITLTGTLLATDRVVFTTIDTNGNLSETLVAPTTLDAAAGTLTVVVPTSATTGAVRLERDTAGILLQVVPVISSRTVNGNVGFWLGGSGFAEGTTEVFTSGFQQRDPSRYYGTDVDQSNGRLYAILPSGNSATRIWVRTVGGTSAVWIAS